MEYKYKRILLKLSGEAMALKRKNEATGETETVGPYDTEFLKKIAKTVKELTDGGVQVGIVTGGGNVFRGAQAKEFTRARADDIGMLVTVMNALAVENIFNGCGVKSVAMTAVEMNKVADLFTKQRAETYLQNGYTVIFGGGTGNPYFSTDTAAVLRGCEINADAVFLAKNIDAVYSADPKTNPDAFKYETIPCKEMIEKGLKVIDISASTIAESARMPMELFSLKDTDNILRAARGERAGTTITV